jgi:phosphoribosyl-AMP cyclohydrolase
MEPTFASITDNKLLETGAVLAPRFGAGGLVTAVVTDADSGEVLMLAHMNAEALRRTLETGEAWYWSRSRAELWHKGATSGTVQKVAEVRVDCDQDAIWLKVRPQGAGAACHTGMRGCFFRRVVHENGQFRLEKDGSDPLFDPDETYRKR